MGALAPDQDQIKKEIETYSDAVRTNNIARSAAVCLMCGEPSEHFKRHEARPRKFRIIIDQLVLVVLCLVIRWKCTRCGKTFTQQPPFAFPHKRFTVPTLQHYCEAYLADPGNDLSGPLLPQFRGLRRKRPAIVPLQRPPVAHHIRTNGLHPEPGPGFDPSKKILIPPSAGMRPG